MDALKATGSCNYVETWIGRVIDKECFETSLSEEEFHRLLSVMKRYHAKCSQGDYKSFTCYDMVLTKKIHHVDTEDIKVFQQKLLDSETQTNTQTFYMERKKLASVLFPSTCNIHRTTFFRKLTFRINHRVFVNFLQEKEQGHDLVSRKAFLNFNSSKDVDLNEQAQLMKKIAQDMVQALTSPQHPGPTSGTALKM